MAGKKKTEKQLIKEISKLAVEVTLEETETKKKKSKKTRPKVIASSYSTKADLEKWEEAVFKDEYYDLDSKESKKELWPKIIRGSHSTRTEHEDGRVEFVTHWDELTRDVQNALTEYENSVKVNTVKTTKRKKKNEA